MKDEQLTKRKHQEEIERARRQFFAKGGRVRRINTPEADAPPDVKPRKQRLKMFA